MLSRGGEGGDERRIADAKKATLFKVAFSVVWLREPDLNRRPSGYEPDELPGCSIPRLMRRILQPLRKLSMLNY